VWVAILLILPTAARADEPQEGGATPPFNLTTPTMGGKQFWSDQLIFRGWRIQKNLVVGHYRLLDDKDARRAWGTFDVCQNKLQALRDEGNLPPMEGEIVLVLHGLGRSRSSMAPLCKYLEQKSKYTTLNMSYATTRGTVDDHADSLARVIDNLDPGVTRINFVAHSLGNIVIRRFLYDFYGRSSRTAPRPRIGRMVMLGPPNQGSQLAERFSRNPLVRWIGGSTAEFASGWTSLQQHLATPRCQFGIIAGGQRDGDRGNALLRGDNDFVVRVQETKLLGARDFVVLPVYHGVMMNNSLAREYTLRFLKSGYFLSEAERHPILEQTVADHDE
jgi:hypothetical protein